MKSVTKKIKRKSQREAARLKRQADPDPAMEEDEEMEVHFNRPENTPDIPPGREDIEDTRRRPAMSTPYLPSREHLSCDMSTPGFPRVHRDV